MVLLPLAYGSLVIAPAARAVASFGCCSNLGRYLGLSFFGVSFGLTILMLAWAQLAYCLWYAGCTELTAVALGGRCVPSTFTTDGCVRRSHSGELAT